MSRMHDEACDPVRRETGKCICTHSPEFLANQGAPSPAPAGDIQEAERGIVNVAQVLYANRGNANDILTYLMPKLWWAVEELRKAKGLPIFPAPASPGPVQAPAAGDLVDLVREWIACDDDLARAEVSPIRKDILEQNALDAKEQVRAALAGSSSSSPAPAALREARESLESLLDWLGKKKGEVLALCPNPTALERAIESAWALVRSPSPSQEGAACKRCGDTGYIGHQKGYDGEAYEIDCPECRRPSPAVDAILRLAGDLARAEKQYRECLPEQKAIAWKIMEECGDRVRKLIEGKAPGEVEDEFAPMNRSMILRRIGRLLENSAAYDALAKDERRKALWLKALHKYFPEEMNGGNILRAASSHPVIDMDGGLIDQSDDYPCPFCRQPLEDRGGYYTCHNKACSFPLGIAPAAPSQGAQADAGGACLWYEEDRGEGPWHSSCGRVWEFTVDGPKENEMDFCIGCGKRVEVGEPERETEEDEDEPAGSTPQGGA